MSDIRKSPSLRFPSYHSDWNEKFIGDICEIRTGNKDTQNKKVLGKYPFFVRSNTVEKIDTYSYNGEAILTSGDGVGVGKNFHYINGKFDFHQRVYSLRNFQNDICGLFVYQVFSTRFYKRVQRLSAKNSVDSVRMEMISKMGIYFPTLPEQQKIADFLSTVDKKIQALTRKKELLEQYKKGVMQKMFPTKGRQAPEIRFKKEDGSDYPKWETKRLGDLTIKVDKKNKENKKYPIYSINNKEGFLAQGDQFEGMDSNDRGYDISLYKIIYKNTFAYNPARINVGSIGFSGELDEVIISSLYVCFKTKKLLNNSFLINYMNTYKFNNAVLRYSEGGVRQYLFYENFSNIKIPLPSLEEQLLISKLYGEIDSKISITQFKLNKMNTWKKGLLQKMFV